MSIKELLALPKNEEFVQMIEYHGRITVITTKRILRGSAEYGSFSEAKLNLDTPDETFGVSVSAEPVFDNLDDEIPF